jgi:hypothetical protein
MSELVLVSMPICLVQELLTKDTATQVNVQLGSADIYGFLASFFFQLKA